MSSNERKGPRGYRVLIALGAALLCVAPAMFVSTQAADARAAQASASILAQLMEVRPEVHEPSVTQVPQVTDGSMSVKQVGSYDYIGSVAIPSLGVERPVAALTSDECLRDTPCRYDGSYLNDDLIICGEGYRSHFGTLGSVDIGAEVFFVAVDGTLYRYVVSNIETSALEKIDAIIDDWDLTLFTFNGDGTCRVVRCIRT